MHRVRAAVVSLLLAVGVAVSGCSAPRAGNALPPVSAPAPSGSASTGSASTGPAEGAAAWIEGTVTRVGEGPCYGVLAEGAEYAMYSPDGTDLAEGDRIKARVTPAMLRISCGSGQQVEADTIQVVG